MLRSVLLCPPAEIWWRILSQSVPKEGPCHVLWRVQKLQLQYFCGRLALASDYIKLGHCWLCSSQWAESTTQDSSQWAVKWKLLRIGARMWTQHTVHSACNDAELFDRLSDTILRRWCSSAIGRKHEDGLALKFTKVPLSCLLTGHIFSLQLPAPSWTGGRFWPLSWLWLCQRFSSCTCSWARSLLSCIAR